MQVFNMLQDMRHLIMLDLRPSAEFEKAHIRHAFNVDLDDWQDVFVKAFEESSGQSQYQDDDLRRLLIILPPRSSQDL